MISFFQFLARFLIKDLINFIYYFNRSNKNFRKENIVIYGANNRGFHFSNYLQNSHNLRILFFVDDDKYLHNLNLNGFKIKSPEKIYKSKIKIDKIFIQESKNSENIKKNLSRCKNLGIDVYKIPSINSIESGDIKINNIKPLKFENFINRETAIPDNKLIKNAVQQKNICVTGGGVYRF